MFLKIVIIFLFIIIFFNLRNFLKLNRKQKVFNSKKITTFNKKNFNNWMNLTKKESLISVIPSFSEVNSDELHISPNIELSKYN